MSAFAAAIGKVPVDDPRHIGRVRHSLSILNAVQCTSHSDPKKSHVFLGPRVSEKTDCSAIGARKNDRIERSVHVRRFGQTDDADREWKWPTTELAAMIVQFDRRAFHRDR